MSTPHAPIGRPFGPTPRQRDVLARPFAALRLDPAIIFAALIAPSAYLSPDWYATERLPPTWNYVTVQARGQISRLAPQDLRQLLDDLSAANEEPLPKAPWTSDKMGEELLAKMLEKISGFRVGIDSFEGKAKLSQNRSQRDRQGAADALDAVHGGQDAANNDGAALALRMRKETDRG